MLGNVVSLLPLGLLEAPYWLASLLDRSDAKQRLEAGRGARRPFLLAKTSAVGGEI